MKIGFIGLGSMGGGMARNLIAAGHEVTVYNRTRAKAEALGGLGARRRPRRRAAGGVTGVAAPSLLRSRKQ